MMKWYTVNDLMAGYSLSKWQIQSMCRSGELGYMRYRDKRFSSKGKGQYVIPEGELVKLSAYKTGEPRYKPEHQPSEYLIPSNKYEEETCMSEIVGDYRAYLDSEEWKALREQAMRRDGWTCRMCGTGLNLRVHHVNYEHIGTDKELDDVITLCEECHSKIHVKDNPTEAANEQ